MYIEQVQHKIPEKIEPIEFWINDFDINNIDITTQEYDVEKQYNLLDLSCGFDTETYTVTKYNKNKIVKANGYVYIWQFSLNNYVIYGRTIEEFIYLLNLIAKKFKLSKKKKVRIWVANLGFEFQYIRKFLDVKKLFAKKNREPLYFETDEFVFQDCLVFSGGNLANLAKTYCSTQKLVGDLDYDTPRNTKTVLSRDELNYCRNDVVILSEFNKYIIDTYFKQGFIPPMTKTGLLRESVKQRFIEDVVITNKDGEIVNINTAKIDNFIEMFPTHEEYNILMKYVFRGGYTHANLLHVNEVLSNVTGIDFTSSYPSVMLQSQNFPMRKFKKYAGSLQDLKGRPWYGHFIFKGLKNRTTHSIESISKVVGYDELGEKELLEKNNIVLDNGRILKADTLEVWLTDVDFEVYQKFYTWNEKESTVDNLHYSKYEKLPDYLLDVLKYYYKVKAELKAKYGEKADKMPEYRIAKAMVNSAYGMCVEKYELTKIVYNDDKWDKTIDGTYEQRLGIDYRNLKVNGIPKVVLQPCWGIWITAQARKRLLDMVYEIGDDVIYCDTDSIYFLNYDEHKAVIDRWNDSIHRYNRENFDESFETLGDFDLINKYGYIQKFKTLGAKRYVKTYPNKKNELVTEATIAGLPKESLPKYCEEKNLDIYKTFTNDMLIDMFYADKNAHKYNDNMHSDIITDEQGNTVEMISQSSLGIYKTSFTMTISDYYKYAIEQVHEMERSYFL